MRKLLLIIISLYSLCGKAQALDTLFVNEHHNVAIFFPEKIRQAVVGAENFVFSYNQEHPQFFGLLKGTAGKNSNLLAITQDGKIYSYVLKYRGDLPQVTYFLSPESSVGNELPELPKGKGKEKEKEKVIEALIVSGDSLDRKKDLEVLAAYYSNNSAGKLKVKKKNGIVLQVNEKIHYRDEVYVVFEIANRSNIAFKPDYLRLFLSRGNGKKNASFQKLLQEPDLIYKLPEIVLPGQRKRFVYVFPKFTLGDKERVVVELREKKGNRLLKLNFRN